jgi:putative membrane protein
MRRLIYVLALGLVGGGVALAANVSDKTFVDKAAAGGVAEVKLSKLAMDKSDSTEVKQFARKMVEDHTKAGVELKQIAEKQSIPVPSAMDAEHQKVYDQLSKLSGPAFDQEYMRAMASDHDEAVKLFKQQSEHGQDAELKSFAMKTLPTIEKHDDMAHMDKKELQKQ